MTVGSGWGKDTGGNHKAILDAKGCWGLCTLRGFNKQGRKLDGCRSKFHSSGKLDEARLLRNLDLSEIKEHM